MGGVKALSKSYFCQLRSRACGTFTIPVLQPPGTASQPDIGTGSDSFYSTRGTNLGWLQSIVSLGCTWINKAGQALPRDNSVQPGPDYPSKFVCLSPFARERAWSNCFHNLEILIQSLLIRGINLSYKLLKHWHFLVTVTYLTVEFPSFLLHPSVLFRIISLDKDFYPLNEKVEP